jgi:phosphoglycolate phosphatase
VTIEAVIFDLDGTLIDSLPGIQACLAQSLKRVIPGAVLPPVRDAIGPGVDRMCALLLPDASAKDLDAVVRGFRAAYDAGGWRLVQAYPGVPEVLQGLAAAGRSLYVVTNKPELPTRLILEELGLLDLFRQVVARDSIPTPYVSKADALADLMTGFAIDPSSAVFVGDSVDDSDASRACRVPFVAAAYGYGDGVSGGTAIATIGAITELPGVVACMEVVA